MTNPLLGPPKSKPGERTSIPITFAAIDALEMLSRGECTAADYTYGDAAINRHVLRELVDLGGAVFVSSPTTAIDRARITELGRDLLRQLGAP